MSQIVLHRNGTDPDFTYRKRLDIDFSHLLGKYYVWKCLQHCISLYETEQVIKNLVFRAYV